MCVCLYLFVVHYCDIQRPLIYLFSDAPSRERRGTTNKKKERNQLRWSLRASFNFPHPISAMKLKKKWELTLEMLVRHFLPLIRLQLACLPKWFELRLNDQMWLCSPMKENDWKFIGFTNPPHKFDIQYAVEISWVLSPSFSPSPMSCLLAIIIRTRFF